MRSLTKPFCILLVATSLIGCAQDRNLEDWNREQIHTQLGQLQAATGTYRGTVYSNFNHQKLGTMELSLSTSLRTAPATAGSKVGGQPVLMGNLTLFSARRMALSIQDSYFDPTSGTYKANIPLKTTDGGTIEISLTGRIQDGSFEGTVQADSYENYGGNFLLLRDGNSTDSNSSSASPSHGTPGNTRPDDSDGHDPTDSGNSGQVVLGTYQGTTRFKSGATRPVSLVILSAKESSQEDFIHLFMPIKTVQLTLNYGDSLQLLHQNAEWDQQTGTLRGQTQLSHGGGESLNLSLNCDVNRATDGSAGWSCRSFANNLGLVANTEVSPGTPGTRPGDVLPPGETDPVQVRFNGRATLIDGTVMPVVLSALYPARSRQEELEDLFWPPADKRLQITLLFGDDYPIAVFFDQSRWDTRTQNLHGVATSPGGNSGGLSDITLTCSQFQFSDTKKDFSCNYFSNRQGRIQLEFSPPEKTQDTNDRN